MPQGASRLKALIVDDEEELSTLLAARLSAAGAEVRTAADGAAALALARRWKPSVILADVSMPGLDGWQLCSALAADGKLSRVPVVIMTSWATKDIQDRARKAGAAAVLLKPFDERALPDLLRAAARKRKR